MQSLSDNQIKSKLIVTQKTDHYNLEVVYIKNEIENIENTYIARQSNRGSVLRDNNMVVLEVSNNNIHGQGIDKNDETTLHKETVLDNFKIEVTSDNEDNNTVMEGDEGNGNDKIKSTAHGNEIIESPIHPVVVYIKSEGFLDNEDSYYMSEEEMCIDECIISENEDTLLQKAKFNDDISNINRKPSDFSVDGDSSTNRTAGHRLRADIKTNLKSIKVVHHTPEDIKGRKKPRLKTVDLDKIYRHLIPRNINVCNGMSGEKVYSCDICYKTFGHKSNLRKHITRVHNRVKPYSCDICKKSFVVKSILQRHIMVHLRKKKHICELCNQIFRCDNNLRIHLRIHSGEKPFSCHMCSAAYKDKRDLRKHLKKHSGEKPYSCEICKKAFIIKNKLMRHMITHSDLKPFSCEICKKSFRDHSNLQRHSKKHTGVRPFTCDVCKKSFTEKTVLKNHIRIHTGELPHSCLICKKAFRTIGNMKVHFRRYCGKIPSLAVDQKPLNVNSSSQNHFTK